jgi:outer membrane protein TolC
MEQKNRLRWTIVLAMTLQIAFVIPGYAQLTLEDCRQKARENYPVIKRYGLIEQSKQYSLSNAEKAYLPQLQVNAKATYQSEVVSLPIQLPGVTVPKIPKDQYQAVVDLSQIVWDGGMIRAQKQVIQAGSEVESRQLEVEMYALEDRVNQMYFGILLFDNRLEQNRIFREDLERNRKTIADYLNNGIANPTDVDAVRVEQLNAEQTQTQLQSTRKAYLEMLSVMIGEPIDPQTVFVKPDAGISNLSPTDNRPELLLFDAQNNLFDSQKAGIKSSYMPKLSFFVEGGIGRPGLNMLSSTWDPFYIGGIRLNWNFSSLYTKKNDLHKIEINKNTVETQRELFLYNIRLTENRQNADIQRIRDLMKQDGEIIRLRENIRKAAEAKVANGTGTVTDLMREMTQEDMARQSKAAHEIDLLTAIYNLKNTRNN